MSFRLVPKSVTLKHLERRNGRYFALFQRIFMYNVAVKQLLGLHRFQNLLLILYMYVVVVQKFTFAISSPDEFLHLVYS